MKLFDQLLQLLDREAATGHHPEKIRVSDYGYQNQPYCYQTRDWQKTLLIHPRDWQKLQTEIRTSHQYLPAPGDLQTFMGLPIEQDPR